MGSVISSSLNDERFSIGHHRFTQLKTTDTTYFGSFESLGTKLMKASIFLALIITKKFDIRYLCGFGNHHGLNGCGNVCTISCMLSYFELDTNDRKRWLRKIPFTRFCVLGKGREAKWIDYFGVYGKGGIWEEGGLTIGESMVGLLKNWYFRSVCHL